MTERTQLQNDTSITEDALIEQYIEKYGQQVTPLLREVLAAYEVTLPALILMGDEQYEKLSERLFETLLEMGHHARDIRPLTGFKCFYGQWLPRQKARLGDVAKMRWDDIVDDGIEIKQQKTGEVLWVPLHPELKELLEKTKAERLANNIQLTTILRSAKGLEYTSMNLKHKFGDALRALGIPKDCVFHGLRKTAAVMLAEAGCSTEQIKAITGHRTDQMAAYYAKRANQRVLARAAMKRLEIKKLSS